MLDSDEKIAKFFFGFGLLLAVGAMILGPLDIRSWSIACGVTASFVALAGMFFALQSWNEPDDVSKVQPIAMAPPGVAAAAVVESEQPGTVSGETAGAAAEESEQSIE
ncbi:hypothetical protein [Faecalispora anaeroviscerum]|uniref:hypothetical protein n=1 Tax=Faecalispora anaeroviscerum TaxID=2991836 RepID=UPI0024B9F2A2|nr:hypothetical protein [Faecalispora anaeroviscerum]